MSSWVRVYFSEKQKRVGEEVSVSRVGVTISDVRRMFRLLKPEIERKLRKFAEKYGLIVEYKR